MITQIVADLQFQLPPKIQEARTAGRASISTAQFQLPPKTQEAITKHTSIRQF